MTLPAQKPLAPTSAASTAARPGAARPGTAKPAAPAGPTVRKLKKGDILFSEGETSSAMYLIKSGVIRVFKKKGDGDIELDTVRQGQILGELAFLDGNPRSATCEALTDCELMEISSTVFAAVVTKMPDWLKILLKAVVGRLRTASTRIKQLESSSQALDYSGTGANKSYVFLSPGDAMKISASIILVASRYGKDSGGGTNVSHALLQRYANQIINVPMAKVTSFIDLLCQASVAATTEESPEFLLKDLRFLEQYLTYMNEENLVDASKRHDITLRGFLVMSLISKHITKFPKDATTGIAVVNVAEIKTLETLASGKEPFRMDEFAELAKLGYCTNLNMVSITEQTTAIKLDHFYQSYRIHRLNMTINALNEQKRKAGAGAK